MQGKFHFKEKLYRYASTHLPSLTFHLLPYKHVHLGPLISKLTCPPSSVCACFCKLLPFLDNCCFPNGGPTVVCCQMMCICAACYVLKYLTWFFIRGALWNFRGNEKWRGSVFYTITFYQNTHHWHSMHSCIFANHFWKHSLHSFSLSAATVLL